MKRIVILLLIVALAVASAAAEGTAFSFRGTAWGMTAQEVRDAEKGKPDADTEAGFDVLEYEDVTLYGFECDIDYWLRDDALRAVTCEYDTEDTKADFESIQAAVQADFGEPIEPDTERWMLMKDILDGEFGERRVDNYVCWQLADDTLVTLVEDAEDESIELGFFDELKLVEAML